MTTRYDKPERKQEEAREMQQRHSLVGKSPEIARYNTTEWKSKAKAIQEPMSQILGNRDWDCISKGERLRLERKVGFWLHGAPELEPSQKNMYLGYGDDQVKQIQSLCDTLTKNIDFENEDIHFAVVFIVVGFDEENIKKQQKKLQEETTKLLESKRELEQKLEKSKEEDHIDQKAQNKLQSRINQVQKDLEKLEEAQKFDTQTMKLDQILPLFKCKAAKQESYCIVDGWKGRSYNSWEHFVQTEDLPGMCGYCAPLGGVYNNQGELQVENHESRASSLLSKVLKVVDKVLPVVEFTVAVVSITVPFVGLVTLAVVGVGAAIYQVTRSSLALDDLRTHGQSLSLKDRDALGHWLNIGVAIVGACTPGVGLAADAVEAAARVGTISIIRGFRLAFSGLAAASNISRQALAIANEISKIMEIERSRRLEPHDFENLKFLYLAYQNVSISYGSEPTRIFKQAQTDFRNSNRAGLPLTLMKDMKGQVGSISSYVSGRLSQTRDSVQESHEFEIKNTMHLIQLMTSNFRSLVPDSELRKHFNEQGQLVVNPLEFPARIQWMQVVEQTRLDVYHSAERFYALKRQLTELESQPTTIEVQRLATINARAELQSLEELCEAFKISFGHMHQSVKDILCKRYSEVLRPESGFTNLEQILVGGWPIFKGLSGHQLNRLAMAQIVQDPLDEEKSDLLGIVHAFAEHMKCRGFRMYLKYAEYVSIKFYQKREEFLRNFRQTLLINYQNNNGGYHAPMGGLRIDRAQAHTLAVAFFKCDYQLKALEDGFRAFSEAQMLSFQVPLIGSLSSNGSDTLAAHRYHKHKYFEFQGDSDSKLQTEEQYTQLVDTVFGRAVDGTNNNDSVTVVSGEKHVDGSYCSLVTWKCPRQGGVVVVVVNRYSGDDGNTSGIITSMSYSSPPIY